MRELNSNTGFRLDYDSESLIDKVRQLTAFSSTETSSKTIDFTGIEQKNLNKLNLRPFSTIKSGPKSSRRAFAPKIFASRGYRKETDAFILWSNPRAALDRSEVHVAKPKKTEQRKYNSRYSARKLRIESKLEKAKRGRGETGDVRRG